MRNLSFFAALSIFLVSPGCGSDTADNHPDASQQLDASEQTTDDAAVPLPDADPLVTCDDLDEVIDLSAQVAANAQTDRGRYPIVLAHGFFGFDEVGPLEYFNGAEQALRDGGFAAYVTAVEPIASSLETRGPELGRQIACISMLSGSPKVNLVGHSQGGLDARVVASHTAFSQFVASVTTVATPHRGTIVADAALGLLPDGEVSEALLDAIADFWGYVTGAPEDDAAVQVSLEQLSEFHSTEFNLATPDNENLEYFSWTGRTVRNVVWFDYGGDECDDAVLPNPTTRDVVDAELYPTHEFLNLLRGRNDGLVTLESTKWGIFMGCIPADHADQIGLLSFPETNPLSGYNHKDFFTQVAYDLEIRGY